MNHEDPTPCAIAVLNCRNLAPEEREIPFFSEDADGNLANWIKSCGNWNRDRHFDHFWLTSAIRWFITILHTFINFNFGLFAPFFGIFGHFMVLIPINDRRRF